LTPPLPLLLKTFAPFTDLREEFWFKIAPYFRLVHFAPGQVLWQQGDEAGGMYVIEHGILKAVYKVRLAVVHRSSPMRDCSPDRATLRPTQFTAQEQLVSESMVAGTVAGELTFISRTPRNATVTAEMATSVWMLDLDGLERLEEEKPREAIKFVKVLMKVSKEEHDSTSTAVLGHRRASDQTLIQCLRASGSPHVQPCYRPVLGPRAQSRQGGRQSKTRRLILFHANISLDYDPTPACSSLYALNIARSTHS
jgi:CRP-like cAMP-binding protein